MYVLRLCAMYLVLYPDKFPYAWICMDTHNLARPGSSFEANTDTLNSKVFSEQAPNHAGGSSALVLYNPHISNSMSEKTLGKTLVLWPT